MKTAKSAPIKIQLNIGGELNTGDVVGVAYNNCIVFGWFVERGQYGSLKYIGFQAPKSTKQQYDDFVAGKSTNQWWTKRFATGLHFKHIMRDYVIAFSKHDNRAFKITNPEEFFRGTEQESIYLESKKVLNDINFPAK